MGTAKKEVRIDLPWFVVGVFLLDRGSSTLRAMGVIAGVVTSTFQLIHQDMMELLEGPKGTGAVSLGL